VTPLTLALQTKASLFWTICAIVEAQPSVELIGWELRL
jgi:hypothetical protein